MAYNENGYKRKEFIKKLSFNWNAWFGDLNIGIKLFGFLIFWMGFRNLIFPLFKYSYFPTLEYSPYIDFSKIGSYYRFDEVFIGFKFVELAHILYLFFLINLIIEFFHRYKYIAKTFRNYSFIYILLVLFNTLDTMTFYQFLISGRYYYSSQGFNFVLFIERLSEFLNHPQRLGYFIGAFLGSSFACFSVYLYLKKSNKIKKIFVKEKKWILSSARTLR